MIFKKYYFELADEGESHALVVWFEEVDSELVGFAEFEFGAKNVH